MILELEKIRKHAPSLFNPLGLKLREKPSKFMVVPWNWTHPKRTLRTSKRWTRDVGMWNDLSSATWKLPGLISSFQYFSIIQFYWLYADEP